MPEFTLTSGAKLNITMCSYEEADALHTAILRAIKLMNLDSSILKTELDLDKPSNMLTGNGSFVELIINNILAIATSNEVKQALWQCFGRVTYNNSKYNKELLDDAKLGEQARKDYYPVAVKVIEVNCSPFFVGALSGLKELLGGSIVSPAPKLN